MVNYPTYHGNETCLHCKKLNKLVPVKGTDDYEYTPCDCRKVPRPDLTWAEEALRDMRSNAARRLNARGRLEEREEADRIREIEGEQRRSESRYAGFTRESRNFAAQLDIGNTRIVSRVRSYNTGNYILQTLSDGATLYMSSYSVNQEQYRLLINFMGRFHPYIEIIDG